MKTPMKLLAVALTAGAMFAAPLAAEARSGGVVGGVGMNHGSGGHGNWGGSGQGGWRGGHGHGGYGHGGYRYGGYWGAWPYYWGGLALGLGIGAAYYYGPYGYGYYAYPPYGAPAGAEYIVADPPPGDRVVRSGQPVPSTQSLPDPIFYPKNGQTLARTEADRQECNRWATTQNGAMSDASIFQRATFACMEGRGYTVR
jgi:hypothetical protein